MDTRNIPRAVRPAPHKQKTETQEGRVREAPVLVARTVEVLPGARNPAALVFTVVTAVIALGGIAIVTVIWWREMRGRSERSNT